MSSNNHSYHLVEPSPWPAVGAAAGFVLALGGAMYMHEYEYGGITSLVGFGLVFFDNVLLVERYCKRRGISRPPQSNCSNRS